MANLLYAINIILPLVLLVVFGYVLRKINLIGDGFVAGANKIVFYAGVPAMLFKAVYDADFASINPTYILYVVGVTLLICILSLIVYGIVYRKTGKVGTLAQAMMRSNYTLIGIPLVLMIFAEGSPQYTEATTLVSLVAAFYLPTNTIISVLELSLCDNKNGSIGNTLKTAIKGLFTNPLILAILAGLVFSLSRYFFLPGSYVIKDSVPFIYKTITYLSQLATPLALIMVGAKFKFSATKNLAKYLIGGVVGRSVMVPLLAFGIATIFFKFKPAEYACLFAAFASPTAVSSVPVVEKMGGDEELAGQIVVFTTFLSPFVIVILLTILKGAALI